MAFATLYGMRQDARERKALPGEWKRAGDFLHWAAANGYKAGFGYKGEFSPEICAKSNLALRKRNRTALLMGE